MKWYNKGEAPLLTIRHFHSTDKKSHLLVKSTKARITLVIIQSAVVY